MSLIDKISSMKEKTTEADQRLSKVERQLESINSRFTSFDQVLRKVSEVEVRIGDLTQKINQKVSDDEKRIQHMESQFSSRMSELGKIENWTKEREKQNAEREDRINKKVDGAIHSEEKIKEQLDVQINNLLETITKNQREIENKLTNYGKQSEVSTLRSSLIKLDEIMKSSITQMETQIAEFDDRIKNCVEYDVLHKHTGEIKVDLANTEGNLKSMFEEQKEEFEEIKSQFKSLPKVDELWSQSEDLMKRFKELEEEMIEKLDDLEKSVSQKEKNLKIKLERDFEAVNAKILNQLQSEMSVLKEQIVNTQDAIVELNTFIREQLS